MAEESNELSIIEEPESGNNNQEKQNTQNEIREDIDNETNLSDVSEDPEQIREKIIDTRREMGETIDAIQEKLSFSNISEQVKEQVSDQINSAVEMAKDAVYNATIRKAGNFMQNAIKEIKKSNFIKTAGENPFPFIFIGLGAGLLLFKSSNKGKSSGKGGRHHEKEKKSSLLKSAPEKVTEAASQTYEQVSKAANSAYESVSNAADSAYKSVGSGAGELYEKVGNLGSQAREKYDYYLEENPLAVGVAALAIGAAVGLAIPATKFENNLLGEVHENLLLKAEDVTRDALEKVQQVADEVGKTIN